MQSLLIETSEMEDGILFKSYNIVVSNQMFHWQHTQFTVLIGFYRVRVFITSLQCLRIYTVVPLLETHPTKSNNQAFQ